MSLLVRLKNKLQDPSLCETKIREFDECMSHLKTENAELHKRIDQLEALCKTSMKAQHAHFLEEHIRKLEQENERLFVENQFQRQEYERFLDQLTTMVIRTAVMQENIRKECASIYHIIERLSILTINTLKTKEPLEFLLKERKRSSSWDNLTKSCEIFSNYQMPKLTEGLIHSPVSLSSSSSSTTNCSMSTSDSWTVDRSSDRQRTKSQILVSNKPKVEIEEHEEQEKQVLQRSETFTVSKIPQEELPSCTPPVTLDDSNNQHNSTPQATVSPTKLFTEPSLRVPSRCSNVKMQSSTVNRSLSAQKSSKLPIRTANSATKQMNSMKKSNIPVSTVTKTKCDASNRPAPLKNTNANNTIPKKPNRPITTVQTSPCKTRSRSAATTEKTNTKPTITAEKPIKVGQESIKPNSSTTQQMNSPSSDSSIEERQNINKLLSILQDEGYSTWSSMDIKDDRITTIAKNIETTDKQGNIELIKAWLDTSKKSCLNKPVNEAENDKQEDISSHPNSYVNTYYIEDTSFDLPSTKISSSNKDISLDSLDSPQSKDLPVLSSNTFSRSETYDKPLIIPTLQNPVIDLDESSSSSSSSSTFNMREYIEDNLVDENDSTSSDDSSSYETMIISKKPSLKPQKRLLFPGILNRLVFFRRTLSDSDLQQKKFYLNETENQHHVYHSNIINEHSVEINLMNTYGSDTELHVWSNNCAEQRKFLSERQTQITNHNEDNNLNFESYNQQLALERQILLQQIYEYPWLLQENDLDQTTVFSTTKNEQTLASPSTDLFVPTHNPDFYQLCALTNSSSFVISHDPNGKSNNLTTS